MQGGLPAAASTVWPAAGNIYEPHSGFGSVLLVGLRGSGSRCVLPIETDTPRPKLTTLHVEGVNPAIWIGAHDDGMIDIEVERGARAETCWPQSIGSLARLKKGG